MTGPGTADKAMPPIAVVGMSGRFPGASTLETFWQVIAEGRDTISRFTAEDLAADEPNPADVQDADNYVRARGILQGVENFDAGFFGFSPAEAALLDPQHRLWLEVAWEALESSGYGHGRFDGAVGVFAGGFSNNYLLNNVLQDRRAVEEYVRMRKSSSFAQMLGNDNAFLAARAAYKFDLRGPAINVQTACSTSLVAVAMAVQSLLTYESDACLVGGVCVSVPQRTGYFYQEGAIFSRDGVCRPYDKDACGTVFSNGAGAVVLRRLDDALLAGDHVLAVIRGAALNNDGHHKVSFTAPSVEGQAEVIATAHAMAGIEARSIGYIEGHGTATPMGDPIEVAALSRAFGGDGAERGYCALGSVKANIGHLDAAAGIAGFIKTVLVLQHGYLPPTAHFSAPNPDIQLEKTPFFVPDAGRPWSEGPRRAGVSSFGIGGTNVHVVLEEAPPVAVRLCESTGKPLPFVISAESEQALSAVSDCLLHHLQSVKPESRPDAHCLFEDYACTLATRRKAFRFRRVVVASSFLELSAGLEASGESGGQTPGPSAKLVYMFPGQGSMQAGISASLIAGDAVFAQTLEHVAGMCGDKLGLDLWGFFRDPEADLDLILHDNARLQLSILAFEIALYEALKARGILPDVVMGHSLGEWTALYCAGVLSLADVVEAVFHRGSLMQTMPPGGAVAVRLPEEDARAYVDADISIAAVNGVKACLLSGENTALQRLLERLAQDQVQHRLLPIHVAVHSPLIDPLIEPFAEVLSRLTFDKPRLPILCTATGTFLSDAEATDPAFWARQMRVAVNFAGAMKSTEGLLGSVLVEVGPGQALSGLARPQLPNRRLQRALPLLPPEAGGEVERHGLLPLLGRLWVNGVNVDLAALVPSTGRVADLPSYPFQRTRHWIEAPAVSAGRERGVERASARPDSVRPITGAPSKSHAASVPPLPASTDAQVQRLLLEMSGLSPADLDLDTPFADTGLDSLFLAQFAEEISRRFAIRVGFRELSVDHNTVNKLARFLDSRGANVRRSEVPRAAFVADAAFSGLVVLRSGADQTPFIFIHGDRANDFLLKYMPEDQPVYGYLHQCDSGERIQYASVEALAARCMEEILGAFPEGPVILGGHSYGGIIAYHVAHMLRLVGREVKHLILMDAYHPTVLKRGNARLRHPVRGPILRAKERLSHSLAIARAEVYLNREEPVPPELRNGYVLSTYDRACEAYDPPASDISTTLFQVSNAIYDLPGYGWPGLLRNLEVVLVEGDHLSIVRSAETFAPLGARIAGVLQAVTGRSGGIAS